MGLYEYTFKRQIGFSGDGLVFGVDPGNGKDTYSGERIGKPLKTMQAAIDKCVAGRGDVILRFPGGESISTTVAFNKSGITVRCVDYGCQPMAHGELHSMYSAATHTDQPVAIITERCVIDGMGFVSRDSRADFYNGSALKIGSGGDAVVFGVHILNCRFPKWGLDNSKGISIDGASDTRIEGCGFEGVGSDLTVGIYAQGATENLDILGNTFRDCTTGIVFHTFAGGGPDAVIAHNKFFKIALSIPVTAPTLFCDNWLMTATDEPSYTLTVDQCNALGVQFADNHYPE